MRKSTKNSRLGAMNGGKSNSLSVRGERKKRIREQNKLLNYLRLAYWLSPEKLREAGISAEAREESERSDKFFTKDVEYINNLFDKLSLPSPDMVEFLAYIQAQEVMIGVISEYAEKKGLSSIEKQIQIDEYTNNFANHWKVPESVYTEMKGSLPKAINLKVFLDRVVTHQQYELGKLSIPGGANPPISYAKRLEVAMDQGQLNHEEYNHVLEGVIAREQRWQNSEFDEKKTDRDIAMYLYNKTDPKALQRVRQDRKRLKNNHFL